ncbi:MAG: nitrogenase stabilizing/protective protein NifW [Hyphomicrobiales bacterium]|nr:nitrogenase stabilizing/protective protein NifW [Methylobacteriaceae bacterium]MCC2100475.1 nitrogenase stabilizing/protective protein NifW [Hyphomicrobiales bacterium]HPG04138.1 nitrogenase stabilizing/protective protein NifW [Rhodoblastus sp.]
MSAIDELKALSSAEDFFRRLDVAYESQVLGVARLHILKRMGQAVASLDETLSDDQALAACRAALTAAYAEFAGTSPLQARLFKVLRDHDPARPATRGAFVPLSDLTG